MGDLLVSYAQNREDLILYVLLHKFEPGFYVDVGANDPVIGSVTKFFYDRGWHGINIEPIPSLYEVIARNRKNDININVAVSNKEGHLRLREYGEGKHGWSTLSKSVKQSHKDEHNYNDFEVETKTLKGIFDDSKVGDIDFLKVDVEGFEYEVLSGNDWEKYRPKVIVVEDTFPEKWMGILSKAGYDEEYHDGLNRYFVREDLHGVCTMRDYVEVLLSGSVSMTAEQQAAEKQLKATQQWLQTTQLELLEARELNERLLKQQQLVMKAPENYLGLRSLSRGTIKRVIRKLKRS